jgi:hypothetical protein
MFFDKNVKFTSREVTHREYNILMSCTKENIVIKGHFKGESNI